MVLNISGSASEGWDFSILGDKFTLLGSILFNLSISSAVTSTCINSIDSGFNEILIFWDLFLLKSNFNSNFSYPT